jgi:hypothetical protein
MIPSMITTPEQRAAAYRAMNMTADSHSGSLCINAATD